MKILFDSQIFDEQKYGGISRYFSEIFTELDRENISYRVPITYSNNEYINNVPRFKKQDLIKTYNRRIINKVDFKYKGFVSRMCDSIDPSSNLSIAKKTLKENDFDIFHPTYYNPYFLKYLKNKKFVLTIYDMIHELYPNYFKSDKNKTIQAKKKLAQRADKIIAISESTKKDIIDIYNIPEKKIEVIYLATSLNNYLENDNLIKKSLPKKYILFVGSRKIYKNFFFFIESIAPLLTKDKDLNIVTTGGYNGFNNFKPDEKKLFKKLDIQNQVHLFPVDDHALSCLYQNALCFVFPSLYEGFGIPILEAFSCGCPVICSNSSSLPEVGGNAAKYFNPTESSEILESVEKVIYNNTKRSDMIKKGYSQLKKFSWDKTAQKTIELYKTLT